MNARLPLCLLDQKYEVAVPSFLKILILAMMSFFLAEGSKSQAGSTWIREGTKTIPWYYRHGPYLGTGLHGWAANSSAAHGLFDYRELPNLRDPLHFESSLTALTPLRRSHGLRGGNGTMMP